MTDPRIEAAARAICEYAHQCEGELVQWHEITEALRGAARRYALRALAAADAAAWRPMSEAPRDGTYVDLWVINSDGEGHRITDAYYGPIPHTCGEYGQYCDGCPEEGSFWIDGIFGHQVCGDINLLATPPQLTQRNSASISRNHKHPRGAQ